MFLVDQEITATKTTFGDRQERGEEIMLSFLCVVGDDVIANQRAHDHRAHQAGKSEVSPKGSSLWSPANSIVGQHQGWKL